MKINCYCVESTKLSELLRLINKADRRIARDKISKYDGFISTECEISLSHRWEQDVCVEFYRLVFKDIKRLIELTKASREGLLKNEG